MKTFEITITENWIESKIKYVAANFLKDVVMTLEFKNKRIFNERFRQIEKTGKYYRISEVHKGGKSFIFEILE